MFYLSDESKFEFLVGNHRRRVLRDKEERDFPAFSSKASFSDGMGCISANGMGSLHVLEGTMNTERYIKFLEQHMLTSI